MRYTDMVVVGSRLALYGSSIEQSDWLAISADGRAWQQIASPCQRAGQQLGGSALGTLIDVCSSAVGGGLAPKEAWTSADGGAHWALKSRSAGSSSGPFGGITWSASPVAGQFGGNAGGSSDVLFADARHGWALGADGVYRTTDGRTWSKLAVLGAVPGYSP